MPSALPHVSRRRVLVGAAALAVLGATSVACGATTPPPDVSTLVAQLDRARADGRLAAGAAAAAAPAIAAALTTVASERTAHAEALTDEIVRVSGEAPAAATSTSPTATGAAPPPPTPGAVVAALEQSASSAAQAAAGQTGYAAGLLGSIAASCTAAHTVALAGVAS